MNDVNVFGIIAAASNIRAGGNPDYAVEDFLKFYPQFGENPETGEKKIPDEVVEAWVKLAHASIHKNRWHDLWEVAIGLFIAHWLTLYLQSAADVEDPIGKIVNAGLAKGLQSSKSADGLSVSYDFGTVSNDLAGWGTYKETAFGQQFATLAKIIGAGGMVVW